MITGTKSTNSGQALRSGTHPLEHYEKELTKNVCIKSQKYIFLQIIEQTLMGNSLFILE